MISTGKMPLEHIKVMQNPMSSENSFSGLSAMLPAFTVSISTDCSSVLDDTDFTKFYLPVDTWHY